MVTIYITCNFSGFDSDVTENSGLLGCDTAPLVSSISTEQVTLIFKEQGSKKGRAHFKIKATLTFP